jgi:hypothetical protein
MFNNLPDKNTPKWGLLHCLFRQILYDFPWQFCYENLLVTTNIKKIKKRR